jgi:hypothetical protein
MSDPDVQLPVSGSAALSRRAVLKLGSATAGGVLLAGAAQSVARGADATPDATAGLPVAAIQQIIGVEGMVSNGVLSIEVDRNDIDNVRNSLGYPIKPSFEVNGNVDFQADGHGGAILNGDLPFRASELQAALDAMQSHGIVFQAMHQHFYDWSPMVWFMHFRGQGAPRALAQGVAAILAATSTPRPQTLPKNPKTPLNTTRLGRILGSTPTVGSDGVVTFDIPRKEQITLAGSTISPYLNVSIPVGFEPLGSTTAVVPDFGMIASEVQPVTSLMRSLGWQVGCLYNQETDEHPQLYFSHMFKAGDPYTLAAEVRQGLNLMNVQTS